MICVMLAAHPIQAEEKTVQMQEVVVTASKIPKTPGNVTQQIDIVSEEKLAEQSPLSGTTNLILREKIDKAMSRLSASYGSYDTYKWK